MTDNQQQPYGSDSVPQPAQPAQPSYGQDAARQPQGYGAPQPAAYAQPAAGSYGQQQPQYGQPAGAYAQSQYAQPQYGQPSMASPHSPQRATASSPAMDRPTSSRMPTHSRNTPPLRMPPPRCGNHPSPSWLPACWASSSADLVCTTSISATPARPWPSCC